MICSFFFIYFCPLRILIINLTIMKRKATLLFLVTFVLLLGAVAQEKLKTVIEPLQNERWWGGFVALGNQMPFNDHLRMQDMSRNNMNNQVVPFMLSSEGRYRWAADYLFRLGKDRAGESRNYAERGFAGCIG